MSGTFHSHAVTPIHQTVYGQVAYVSGHSSDIVPTQSFVQIPAF